MLEFIFYVIMFYIIIKSLKAIARWWKSPAQRKGPESNKSNGNFSSKYKNIEEAEFTEIESTPKNDKVQE